MSGPRDGVIVIRLTPEQNALLARIAVREHRLASQQASYYLSKILEILARDDEVARDAVALKPDVSGSGGVNRPPPSWQPALVELSALDFLPHGLSGPDDSIDVTPSW